MFHMIELGKFPEKQARLVSIKSRWNLWSLHIYRFYAAEITIGLDFLHSKGIIYRYVFATKCVWLLAH